MENFQKTGGDSTHIKIEPGLNAAGPIHTGFGSNVPNPTAPIPSFQRQDASLGSTRPEPGTARSVLAKGLHKKIYEALPSRDFLLRQHCEALLATPLGRDLTIVTAAGVEFQIHSSMVIGGPLIIQNWLYPFGAPRPMPLNRIFVPTPPILVDRLVRFIYTADYDFGPPGTTHLTMDHFGFTQASPNGTALPAMMALVGVSMTIFHLFMYSLGEQFGYEALKCRAYDKLMTFFINKRRLPSEMKEAVIATFALPGNTARVCQDINGDLQKLVAAAVIVCEFKEWSPEVCNDFAESLQDPVFASFWDTYATIKSENSDLIQRGIALNNGMLNTKPVEQSSGGYTHDEEEDNEENLAYVHQRLAQMSL